MKKKFLTSGILLILAISMSTGLHAEGSKLKAVALSVLVPGAGQAYLGRTTQAEAFITAEVASWIAYFGFRHHGYALENQAISYAYTYGNLSVTAPDERFWKALELNISRDMYIENLFREARQFYPDDPDSQVAYVNAHAVPGSWQWPSENEWFHFQDLRTASRSAYQKAMLVTGVLILNRIASVVELFVNIPSKDVSLRMGASPYGIVAVGLNKRF